LPFYDELAYISACLVLPYFIAKDGYKKKRGSSEQHQLAAPLTNSSIFTQLQLTQQQRKSCAL